MKYYHDACYTLNGIFGYGYYRSCRFNYKQLLTISLFEYLIQQKLLKIN